MIPFPDKGHIQDISADLEALRQLAKDEAPSIGQILFGEHGKKEGNSLRFEDRKVSLVIQGEKRGISYDYVSCEGGDMFMLIGRQTGADFRGQVDWMRKYRGGAMPQMPARARQNQIDNDATRAAEIKKLRDVEALIRASVPIAGTPAETYLQSRNIEAAKLGEYWLEGEGHIYRASQPSAAQRPYRNASRLSPGEIFTTFTERQWPSIGLSNRGKRPTRRGAGWPDWSGG